MAKLIKSEKKVGGDIARNKRTLLYLRAINKANPTQKQKLIDLGNETDTDLKIKETLNVFEELGIKEDVSNTAAEYFNQSLDHLDSVNISDERKTILRELANRIYNRDF